MDTVKDSESKEGTKERLVKLRDTGDDNEMVAVREKENMTSNNNNAADENARAQREQYRFRVLDALYTISRGYTRATISIEDLYRQLQATNNKSISKNNEQERIREALADLRHFRLASPGFASASITHQGIIEYERAILNPSDSPNFSFNTIQSVYDKTKENQVRNIQNQRDRFLDRAHELSGGSSMTHLSATEIAKELHYEDETRDRIYFFLQDEGRIVPSGTAYKFTFPSNA